MSASADYTEIPSDWETTGRRQLSASLFIHTSEAPAIGHSSNGIYFRCLLQGISVVVQCPEACSLSRNNTPGNAVVTMHYRI